MQQRINIKKELLPGLAGRADNLSEPDDIWQQIETLIPEDATAEMVVGKIYDDIILLRMLIDSLHGISSSIVRSANQERAWVRVRKHSANQSPLLYKDFIKYNLLRIFYAYLIAAISIARIYRFQDGAFLHLIAHIKMNVTNLLRDTETDSSDELLLILAEGKAHLLTIIDAFNHGFTKAEMNSKLDQAKDWVGLEAPSIPIYTFMHTDSRFDNQSIVIIDDPCSELTEEQRASFNNLSEKKWFTELDDFTQALVRYYAPNITSGSRVIPSKLRSYIPLCKNSYLQSIWVLSPTGAELLNAYYHSGTIAHLSHKDSQTAAEISRNNMRQQKHLAQTDVSLMVCLNSSMVDMFLGRYERFMGREYSYDDGEIIRLTSGAAAQLAEHGIFYSKLCINILRMLEYNDYSGLDKVVAIIKDNLAKLDLTLPLVKQLQHEYNRLVSLEWQITPLDVNVKCLDIVYVLTRVATLNNQLVTVYPALGLKSAAIWFGCASGENRTGITYFHTICSTIIDYFSCYLKDRMTKQVSEEVIAMIASSQHVLVTTGHQGTTFGTEGIRGKSSGSFRNEYPKAQLVTLLSDIKKIPVFDRVYYVSVQSFNEAIIDSEKVSALKLILPIIKEFLQTANKFSMSHFFMKSSEKKIISEMLQHFTKFLTDKEKSASCLLIANLMNKLLRYEAENIGKESEHFRDFSLAFKKVSEQIFIQFKPVNAGSHSPSGMFSNDEQEKSPVSSLSTPCKPE